MRNAIHKCVGLIIKNRSISAVEIQSKNKLPLVTNYSKILLEEGIIENDCIILNKESFQEAIKKLLANGAAGPISTTNLFISLPEEKAFIHQITILKEKATDIEYIKEIASDFIPIELSQAVFDYKIVHEDVGGKMVIANVVAIPNNVAQPIIDTLKIIGLEVTRINVDIYCLIKSFHNSLNNNEGAFLLLNMELSRDFMAIVSADDRVNKIISKGGRSEMLDKLKVQLNASNDEELNKIFIDTRRGNGMTEAQKAILKNSFKDYLEDLSNKIHQLIDANQAEEVMEIKRIYLTGLLSAFPGIEEILGSLLPGVQIKKSIQYVEVPLEIEGDAIEGIGLCMNGCLPDDKNNYNLLPQQRINELCFREVYPESKLFSLLLAVFFTLITIKTGITASSNYLNYRISSREVAILSEQALNPYISQMAHQKQEIKQNKSQILLLSNDSVPVSYVIRNLDTYNKNGINIVSFDYKDFTSAETAEMSLKATVINRDSTEKLITALQDSGYYSRVDSPLSNLIGKGERFISIGLGLEKAKIIEYFEKGAAPLTKENNEQEKSK